MCRENPSWGAPRIHGEPLKLGIDIGESSVTLRVTPRATKTRLFHEASVGVENDVQGSHLLRLGVSVHQESLAILCNIIREQIC